MTFRAKCLAMAALVIVLLLALLPALLAGEYDIAPGDVFRLLWAKVTGASTSDLPRVQEVIVWRLRTPRMLLALGAGIALSASGAAYQGVFRNPLVEPYILGVSSGAACGAALAIVWPMYFPPGQVSALVFALAAVFLAWFFARQRGQTQVVTLVLSGIIVGALFFAVVGIVKYLADDSQLREITFWMLGGLHSATWDAALINLGVSVVCLVFLWSAGWKLNLLALSDDEARSLGLNPSRLRIFAVFMATVAAAVCVSFTGIVAWVGLMMPHAARMIFGPDHRWIFPGAALLGAIYILLCDTIARTLTGAEIPLGIITSIVGAPYLLWLLRSKGRDMYGV